jgi:hypothetical protein
VGDGGVVAADFVLGCVGHREKQRATEGIDDLVVGGPGEVRGEVGRTRGVRVHVGKYAVRRHACQPLVLLELHLSRRDVGSCWSCINDCPANICSDRPDRQEAHGEMWTVVSASRSTKDIIVGSASGQNLTLDTRPYRSEKFVGYPRLA